MNTKPPIVSVLLPVFNCATYLSTAIQSILSQSFSEYELLLLDDGSTDDTRLIIESQTDPRVKKFFFADNLGLVTRLNQLMDLSSGEFFARMDADDITNPNRLAIQVAFMQEHPEILVCGTAVEYFNSNGISGIWVPPCSNVEIAISLLAGSAVSHPTVMIRREPFIKHGFRYSKDYIHAEDYELWTRVIRAGFLITNLKQPLHKYRIHQESVSAINRKAQEETSRIIRIRFLSWLLNRHPNEWEIQFIGNGIPNPSVLDLRQAFFLLTELKNTIALILGGNKFQITSHLWKTFMKNQRHGSITIIQFLPFIKYSPFDGFLFLFRLLKRRLFIE